MRTQLTAFIVLALSATALARPGGGVDQWVEQYAANIKIGYSHMRISAKGDGYEKIEEEWIPIPGGVVSETSTVTTDRAGVVLTKTTTRTSALGKVTTHVERAGDVVKWRHKARAQAERSGEVKAPIHDTDVMAHLIAIGKLEAKKHTVQVLDMPAGVLEAKEVSATKEGANTVVIKGDQRLVLNASGQLVTGSKTDAISLMNPVSEAEAKDMTRAPQAPIKVPGLANGTVTKAGVTLTRPGAGWVLIVPPAKSREPMGLMHPHEAGMIVIPLPVDVPEDETARLTIGQQLMQQVNSDKKLQLASPKVEQAWGSSAVHYTASLVKAGSSGDAYLIRRGPQSSVLVMILAPNDLKEKLAVQLEQLRSAISLKAPAAAKAQAQGAFPCGATFQLPGWKRTITKRQRVCWNSPGGSQIQAWAQPSQTDVETAANQWAQGTAPQFKTKAPPATEVKVGNRAGWGTSFAVTAPNGVGLTLKLIVVPSDEAGKIVLVMLVAGPDLDEPAMQKILSSATWK